MAILKAVSAASEPELAEKGVVEIAGRQGRQPRGELEDLGVAELEGRGEIELGGLLLNGLDDARAAMAGIGAP